MPSQAPEEAIVIVPHAIGFTEATRRDKQRSQASKQFSSTEVGEAQFWRHLATNTTPDEMGVVQTLLKRLQQLGHCKLSWRVGCLLYLPDLVKTRGLLSFHRNGNLEIQLGFWSSTYPDVAQKQVAARDKLVSGLIQLGVVTHLQTTKQFPIIEKLTWILKAKAIGDLLESLAGSQAIA